MKILKKITLFILLVIAPQVTFAQCAMCRAVLESEADGGAAEAINDGIVYLMVWPYLLMGLVGFIIYRMVKKGVKTD
ncbi:hypothetical protein SAMN04488096_105287 [Mesonia phycicola]|uniref:Uncharacterized protein n=1 Tax=Mesonia phycicola TaxID=579105 RepID=A0A1M6EVU4_9FLAO|nr:hypothetical protein [Mesonia phycicola]SHI89536.1 hypothetical protein SAMN04488096_105287 [Mesonia phycicola]